MDPAERREEERLLFELEALGFKSDSAVVSPEVFWSVSLPCQPELILAKCLLGAGTGYLEGFGNCIQCWYL